MSGLEFMDFSISKVGVALTYLVSLSFSDSSANLDSIDDNDNYVDDENDRDRVHGLLLLPGREGDFLQSTSQKISREIFESSSWLKIYLPVRNCHRE